MAVENRETPRLKLSFIRRLSILFVLLAAIMIVVGVRVWQMTDRSVENNHWVSHSYEVESQAASVLARSATIQSVAFAYAVSGDSAQLSSFSGQLPLLESEIEALTKLVQDNPEQTDKAQKFAKAALALRDKMSEIVEKRRTTGKVPESFDVGANQVRAFYRYLITQEDELLVERRVKTEQSATTTRLLTAAAIVLMLFFLAISYWLIRRSHERNVKSQRQLREANVQLGEAFEATQGLSTSLRKLSQFGEILQSCRSLDEVREGAAHCPTCCPPSEGGSR